MAPWGGGIVPNTFRQSPLPCGLVWEVLLTLKTTWQKSGKLMAFMGAIQSLPTLLFLIVVPVTANAGVCV